MSSTTKIRAVLIDLSGTLHIGDQPIAGALEALQKLRTSNCRVKFLTNTSTKSSFKLLEQLNGMGFVIKREELVTSVLATAAYVKKKGLKPLCLMEDTSDLELDNDGGPKDGTSTATEQTITSCDSVVVGLAPSHFHYQRLNEAFRILLEHPDHLIAVHRGNYYRPDPNQPLSLGPGAFVTALETASNCAPAKVMGKPSANFFESALWEHIPPSEVCMIGDDVVADIQGAKGAGIGTAILVQTGKYRAGDKEKLDHTTDNEAAKPFNFVVRPSIVEAVDYILSTI